VRAPSDISVAGRSESDGAEGLTVDGVTVVFGGLTAVKEVSIEVAMGRVTGLIGPNGAGKTTLFNVCSGFTKPQSGHIRLDGRDISDAGPSYRPRLGLGRTFQRMEIFRTLSVRQNIEFGAEASFLTDNPLSLLGLLNGGRPARKEARDRADHLLSLLGLEDVEGRPAGAVSTGHARLVELGRALARGPRVLLLDEPSSGLGEEETESFAEVVRDLIRDSGVGVLLVEHDVNLVLGICERIYCLDFGSLIFEGSPTDLRDSPVVRAAYLGDQFELP
jgi:ABC-type branched-subunit amino acid transport system ATPase component